MFKIEPKFGKTSGYNKPQWYCKNFTIVTASSDKGKCVARHIEKLKKYGYIPEDCTALDIIASDYCRNPWKED